MSVAEATTPVETGTVAFGSHTTWYRVTGTLGSGVPLVVLHGGPGCTWDYLDTLSALARPNRPVVHYDQIGNGNSTHLREAPTAFWSVDLFTAELSNLIVQLGIGSSYALLGQSWGGMLAMEHAVARPAGLEALVLSNAPGSMPVWSDESIRLLATLPAADVVPVDSAGFEKTLEAFRARYVCRVPGTPGLERMRVAIADDPTVTMAMNGPHDFPVSGNLRDWSIFDRVHQIDVPTLLISGEFDQATPATIEPLARNIAGAKWVTLAGTSHIPNVEDPAGFLRVVDDFLQAHGI